MKIKTWHDLMSLEETKDLAYWERNVLALRYADGWYNDDIEKGLTDAWGPRYNGWRRVLSLDGGKITFHIPDDFDVGTLPEIKPNWDGHTTGEKWRRILEARGITPLNEDGSSFAPCDSCGKPTADSELNAALEEVETGPWLCNACHRAKLLARKKG